MKLNFKNSSIHECFNTKNDIAAGRCCMLSSAVLSTVSAQFITGIFYTGFLVGYGINIVDIGIITFVPYFANMVGILAPFLLNRFKKRRWLLFFCRLMYYTINIIGLTLLPQIVKDNTARVVGMVLIVFISNLFNAVACSGYSAWHVRFIPDHVRVDYFSVSMFLQNLIPGIMVLISSQITDALSSTPYQLTVIIILRYVAYAVAIGDVIVLALPKEYPYEDAESDGKKTHLLDIFTIPLRNKKYLGTMIISFVWNFSSFAYSSALVVFLLNDIGVTYTYYNFINLLYSVFFIFFTHFWRKKINKYSWMGVYAASIFIIAPSQFLYCFVTAGNYMWLMTAVRLLQHFIGVGQNMCFANFQYMNMPEDNRTSYSAFYIFVTNAGAALGLALGTVFVAATNGMTFPVLGFTMANVPFLMMLASFVQFGLAIYSYVARKALMPVSELQS